MRIIPELVDGCQLKCALCWNRNRTGTFKQMSLKTVEKILETFGRKNNYFWYNWGEPLLYKEFHEFASLTRRYKNSISSNFSLPISDQVFQDLSKMTELVVSISGMTKEVYNYYHKGGNFDLVMSNIEKIKGFNNVKIHWIWHKDNKRQYNWSKRWCAENGFQHHIILCNCEIEEAMEGFTHPYLKLRHFPSEKFVYCKMQRWVPISVDGEYLTCCVSHNVGLGYTIWDNITYDELLQIKRESALCKKCNAGEYWRKF